MKNTYSGEVVKGNVCHVFKMDDGKHYLGLSGIDPDAYPIGTRITVTLEEPELPKEQIVLPEGMKWMLCNGIYLLYTADGAMIAQVIDAVGTVWPPFKCGEFAKYEGNTEDEAMKLVENALAEHGYFGARKVVENG